MALVIDFDLKVHQINVKIAFFNGDMSEIIYMKHPNKFQEKGKKALSV